MLAFYIKIWGFVFGVIAYGVSMNVIALVLKVSMDLEMMSGADELFFQEDTRNCANIIAYQKYDKFNPDKFAKVVCQRATIFPRIKSKITKFLGKYMFEELSDKYMMDSIPKLCRTVTGIHNEQELADFMAKEQSTRLPLNEI